MRRPDPATHVLVGNAADPLYFIWSAEPGGTQTRVHTPGGVYQVPDHQLGMLRDLHCPARVGCQIVYDDVLTPDQRFEREAWVAKVERAIAEGARR